MENIYDLKGIEEDKTEELDILLMKIKLYHFAQEIIFIMAGINDYKKIM